jgi:hypothetical protein
VCVYVSLVCVYVCVCVRERERACVGVCACMSGSHLCATVALQQHTNESQTVKAYYNVVQPHDSLLRTSPTSLKMLWSVPIRSAMSCAKAKIFFCTRYGTRGRRRGVAGGN